MGKKKSVYIETSILSYLTARPSSDLLAAAWQRATVNWWESKRMQFDLCISDIVLSEAARGDADAAARRLAASAGTRVLPITRAARDLSKALMREGALPDKAVDDALHIAIAAVHGIDYLMTWNCRHIDNAEMKPLIRSVCAAHRHACPEICTPQELMGVSNDG